MTRLRDEQGPPLFGMILLSAPTVLVALSAPFSAFSLKFPRQINQTPRFFVLGLVDLASQDKRDSRQPSPTPFLAIHLLSYAASALRATCSIVDPNF